LHPAETGDNGLPGTTKTSRPCSAASLALIRELLRSLASMTSTPKLNPSDYSISHREMLGILWAAGKEDRAFQHGIPGVRFFNA